MRTTARHTSHQLSDILRFMLNYRDSVDGLYSWSVSDFTRRQEADARSSMQHDADDYRYGYGGGGAVSSEFPRPAGPAAAAGSFVSHENADSARGPGLPARRGHAVLGCGDELQRRVPAGTAEEQGDAAGGWGVGEYVQGLIYVYTGLMVSRDV